jgi:MoaA/NifB/PqqE/SkfB family radical SAM enzyme
MMNNNYTKYEPSGLFWKITSDCTQNCGFCFAKPDEPSADLTSDKTKILSRIIDEGIKYINFTGGEPLLVKNIADLIKQASSARIYTALSTNGDLLTKEFIESVDGYLNQIGLPLDGSNDKIMQSVRGTPHGFSQFHKNMSILENTNIKKRINTLVCDANGNDLQNIYESIKKYNIDEWKLIKYYPITKLDDKFSLSDEKYNSYVNPLMQIKNFPVSMRPQEKDYQESFLLLDSCGNLYITAENKHHIIGNILEDSLETAVKRSPDFCIDSHMKKYSRFKNEK